MHENVLSRNKSKLIIIETDYTVLINNATDYSCLHDNIINKQPINHFFIITSRTIWICDEAANARPTII